MRKQGGEFEVGRMESPGTKIPLAGVCSSDQIGLKKKGERGEVIEAVHEFEQHIRYVLQQGPYTQLDFVSLLLVAANFSSKD